MDRILVKSSHKIVDNDLEIISLDGISLLSVSNISPYKLVSRKSEDIENFKTMVESDIRKQLENSVSLKYREIMDRNPIGYFHLKHVIDSGNKDWFKFEAEITGLTTEELFNKAKNELNSKLYSDVIKGIRAYKTKTSQLIDSGEYKKAYKLISDISQLSITDKEEIILLLKA